MNPSNPAKVGIAFAAGVVVALASAMIYVKSSASHVPTPVAQVSTAQPGSQPESLPAAAKVEDPIAAPAATPAPVPAAKPVTEPPPQPVTPVAKPHHEPVQNMGRRFYPKHSTLPSSQSTIRVEVSQLTPSRTTDIIPPPPIRTVVAEQPPVVTPAPPPQPVYNPPPAPQPHTVTLPAGTNLAIRLGETVSTDHNYNGDTFRGNLDSPIILDGFVIAEKGSKVLGKVVNSEKAGKFDGTASLQLVLTEINTTDGQRVRVETSLFNKKGPSNTNQDVAKMAGGAALGAIIGAIAGGGKGAAIGAGAGGAAGTGAVLLGKGKPAAIASETRLTFQLATATTITERLN